MSILPFLPVIGTGVSTLGGMFSAKSAQSSDMDFQREMWQKNADYNTQMASTQYQRAVKDLEAAGLNPALAYQQGGNAAPSMSSVGGSSAAQAMASSWGNIGNFASALTNATMQPTSLTDLQNTQAKASEAQADWYRSVEELNQKYGLQVDADILLKGAQERYQNALTTGQSQDNAINSVRAYIYSKYPENMRDSLGFGEFVRNAIGGLLSGNFTMRR